MVTKCINPLKFCWIALSMMLRRQYSHKILWKLRFRLTKASRKTLLARTSLKHSVITTCSEVNGRHGLISHRINEQRVVAAGPTKVCKSHMFCDVHLKCTFVPIHACGKRNGHAYKQRGHAHFGVPPKILFTMLTFVWYICWRHQLGCDLHDISTGRWGIQEKRAISFP